ncbi:MAG: hypothetical protein HY865_10195 [Chloroflexi bacterium]|nr:hypothetical protein [Chloroflexota bacterium]
MTILYILIGVAIGWFIGFLDSNRNMEKKVRAAEFNAEIKIEEAEKRAAQAEKKFSEDNPLQGDPGLLRLKKVNGHYLLDLDGTPVTGDLSHDMRKRLVELISVFRLWLDPAQPSTSISQPVVQGKVQGTGVPDPIREAVYGSSQFFDDSMEMDVQDIPQPVSVTEAVLRPAPAPQPVPARKSEADKIISSLSIVQQIDSVLQERLLNSPLALRGIRLQESIQGGVEVYVGSQKFHSVDDVPDAEIKAAIRSAIAIWEKKYTPGI